MEIIFLILPLKLNCFTYSWREYMQLIFYALVKATDWNSFWALVYLGKFFSEKVTFLCSVRIIIWKLAAKVSYLRCGKRLCQRFCLNNKLPKNANFCWVGERKNSWSKKCVVTRFISFKGTRKIFLWKKGASN